MGDPAINEGASTSGSLTDYDQALAHYDRLVHKYEDEHSNLSEADVVILEGQVVKAFCNVLNLRAPLKSTTRPKMNEWLRVVGLSATNIRHIQLLGYHDVLALVQLPENEVRSLAERGRYSPESKRRVLKSCEAVKTYLDCLQGRKESVEFNDKHLSWSVKLASTLPHRGTSVESASPLNSPRFLVTSVDQRNCGRDSPGSAELLIPPGSGSGSFPGSPSPSTTGHSRSASGSGSLSVLTGRTTLSPSSPLCISTHSTPTLGINSRVTHSVSLQFDHMDSSQRSPQLSRMNHTIPHKWHRSTKIRLMSDQICTVCQRPLGLGFLSSWEKCKSCKCKVHTQCKSRIGDTCGLTPDHLRHWVERIITQHNTGLWNDPPMQETVFPFPPEANNVADSSSSTNSSAPSTPAALGMGNVSSPYTQFTAPPSTKSRFTFPDTVQEVEIPDIVLPEGTSESPEIPRAAERLEGSEGTVIGDSTGSAGTDITLSDGSNGGGRSPGHTWDRHRWTMSTIRGGNPQAGWKEVTISLTDIEFRKNPNPLLGHGRFGDVLRGYHFGDVAVKFLNMEHVEESRRLDEFKAEVAAHKNTRHDNIVLFLGCCMEEGRLGIVMSLCKGQSLHRLLHENKDKLELSTAHHIATQICQGISYLHTKKILHKDLRSKNVYVESKHKVVITDFNISSMKRLRHPSKEYSIQVSQHWLVYQAPEIIQSIAIDGRELPFSEKSDAYSFGTLWFELLTYGFPFAREHPDRVIYLVGHGIKPPLHNIKTNKEARPRILEILMRCWSFAGDDRPSFGEISNMLNALPRRRLDRSPSFPMIRSFESNF